MGTEKPYTGASFGGMRHISSFFHALPPSISATYTIYASKNPSISVSLLDELSNCHAWFSTWIGRGASKPGVRTSLVSWKLSFHDARLVFISLYKPKWPCKQEIGLRDGQTP